MGFAEWALNNRTWELALRNGSWEQGLENWASRNGYWEMRILISRLMVASFRGGLDKWALRNVFWEQGLKNWILRNENFDQQTNGCEFERQPGQMGLGKCGITRIILSKSPSLWSMHQYEKSYFYIERSNDQDIARLIFTNWLCVEDFLNPILIGPRCPWGPIYGSWCL